MLEAVKLQSSDRLQGVLISSVQSLLGRWAPSTERSVLTAITFQGKNYQQN